MIVPPCPPISPRARAFLGSSSRDLAKHPLRVARVIHPPGPIRPLYEVSFVHGELQWIHEGVACVVVGTMRTGGAKRVEFWPVCDVVWVPSHLHAGDSAIVLTRLGRVRQELPAPAIPPKD